MSNICMVGTGGSATAHMKAFKEIGGVQPCWAVSRQEHEAQKFGQHWGFDQVSTDLDVALADPNLDLVVICVAQ